MALSRRYIERVDSAVVNLFVCLFVYKWFQSFFSSLFVVSLIVRIFVVGLVFVSLLVVSWFVSHWVVVSFRFLVICV